MLALSSRKIQWHAATRTVLGFLNFVLKEQSNVALKDNWIISRGAAGFCGEKHIGGGNRGYRAACSRVEMHVIVRELRIASTTRNQLRIA